MHYNISLDNGGNGTVQNPFGFSEFLANGATDSFMKVKGIRTTDLDIVNLAAANVSRWVSNFWLIRFTNAAASFISTGSIEGCVVDGQVLTLQLNDVSCSSFVGDELIINAPVNANMSSFGAADLSLKWTEDNKTTTINDCCICSDVAIKLDSSNANSNLVAYGCRFSNTTFTEIGQITKQLDACTSGQTRALEIDWDTLAQCPIP